MTWHGEISAIAIARTNGHHPRRRIHEQFDTGKRLVGRAVAIVVLHRLHSGAAFLGTFAIETTQGERQDFQSLSRNELVAIGTDAVSAIVRSLDRGLDILDLGCFDLHEPHGQFIFEAAGRTIADIGHARFFVGKLRLRIVHDRPKLIALSDERFANCIEQFGIDGHFGWSCDNSFRRFRGGF